MTLAIKRIHNLPPHLSYVSTLPDITQKLKCDIDALKHRHLGPYSLGHHRQSHWPVANIAMCMCKGKGTSLRTPTVTQIHNRFFSEPLKLFRGRQDNISFWFYSLFVTRPLRLPHRCGYHTTAATTPLQIELIA